MLATPSVRLKGCVACAYIYILQDYCTLTIAGGRGDRTRARIIDEKVFVFLRKPDFRCVRPVVNFVAVASRTLGTVVAPSRLAIAAAHGTSFSPHLALHPNLRVEGNGVERVARGGVRAHGVVGVSRSRSVGGSSDAAATTTRDDGSGSNSNAGEKRRGRNLVVGVDD